MVKLPMDPHPIHSPPPTPAWPSALLKPMEGLESFHLCESLATVPRRLLNTAHHLIPGHLPPKYLLSTQFSPEKPRFCIQKVPTTHSVGKLVTRMDITRAHIRQTCHLHGAKGCTLVHFFRGMDQPFLFLHRYHRLYPRPPKWPCSTLLTLTSAL